MALLGQSEPAFAGLSTRVKINLYCDDEDSAKRCEKLCSEELVKCLEPCGSDIICESTCFRFFKGGFCWIVYPAH